MVNLIYRKGSGVLMGIGDIVIFAENWMHIPGLNDLRRHSIGSIIISFSK